MEELPKVVWWEGYPRVVGVNWPPPATSSTESLSESQPVSEIWLDGAAVLVPVVIHDLRAGGITVLTKPATKSRKG